MQLDRHAQLLRLDLGIMNDCEDEVNFLSDECRVVGRDRQLACRGVEVDDTVDHLGAKTRRVFALESESFERWAAFGRLHQAR